MVFACGRRNSRGRFPYAGDSKAAVGALPFYQTVELDIVPGPANKQGLTPGAICVCSVAIDISLVDIMQTSLQGYFARPMQSLRRGSRFILQFEVGMKRSEMQRDVGA